MVVFMYQIPLQRKESRARQAPRCQLSSCQGNEREMWRRGQAGVQCSVVVKSQLTVILLFVRQSKYAYWTVQFTFPLLYVEYVKYQLTHSVSIRSYRQSLDVQMDDDLSRWLTSRLCSHTISWESAGSTFSDCRCLHLQIWRRGSAGQNEMLQVLLFLHLTSTLIALI